MSEPYTVERDSIMLGYQRIAIACDDRMARMLAARLNEPEAPTLRDRFAMAALGGLLRPDRDYVLEVTAKFCYEVADALMKARGGAQ